jgi:hypothetical protein
MISIRLRIERTFKRPSKAFSNKIALSIRPSWEASRLYSFKSGVRGAPPGHVSHQVNRGRQSAEMHDFGSTLLDIAHIALTSLRDVAIESSRPDRAKTQECTTRPSVELWDVRPLGTGHRADSHA